MIPSLSLQALLLRLQHFLSGVEQPLIRRIDLSQRPKHSMSLERIAVVMRFGPHIAVLLDANILIGRDTLQHQAKVVGEQPTHHQQHQRRVDQEADEPPGPGVRALVVDVCRPHEAGVGQRVQEQQREEVLVVVAADHIVDIRAASRGQ